MRKKFSKEALYNEWQKYRKWYEKQDKKDMALSGRSFIIYDSFSEYLFYREGVSEGFTKSEDVLSEIKRLSFTSSRRQLEHLTGEITKFLTAEDTTPEAKRQFLEHFSEELVFDKNGNIDVERIISETLHGKIEPLYIRTGKRHGWYGALAEMMEYIETLGYSVSWNS